MRQPYNDASMIAPDITIQWDQINGQAYQSLMDDRSIAYQQHWAYGEVVRQFGGQTHRGVLYEGKNPIACIQLQTRRIMKCLNLAIAMRGPVWLHDDTSPDIKAACYRAIKRQHTLRWPYMILLMPDSGDQEILRQTGLRKVVSGYSTVMIDLSQGEDTLLAAMDGKWRNQLRSAEKKNVACSKVGLKLEQYRWLLEEECSQRQRIGYAALNPGLVPCYQLMAGKDALLALRATSGKNTVAGILCLIHGNTATYHIGWSDEDGKKLAAHNLLLWEAMKQLKARDITQFDLGGVNTEDGAGIARFKLGTGGALLTLPGTYM